MPDQVFENPRLVEIYDAFDGSREDLLHYLNMVQEMKASSVLDVGCGTGSFSCLLAKNGLNVIGLDPAHASLDYAKTKKYSDQVKWIHGDTNSLKSLSVDIAVMTGNVAQVFVDEDDWKQNLLSIRKFLNSNGHLIFEVRDPEQKAWKNWTKEKTYQKIDVSNVGLVEGWCEVEEVSKDLVTFIWRYFFENKGEILTSKSTLRFREKEEIIKSLENSRFIVEEIRDAPDRPNQEFVFIARVA